MRDYTNQSKVYSVNWYDGTSSPPYVSNSTKLYKEQFRGDLIPSDHVIATPYECARYINDVQSFKVWGDERSVYDRLLRKIVWAAPSKEGKHAQYPPPNYAYELPESLYNSAVADLRSNMGNNNIQLGTALGELPETIGTIVDLSYGVLWCIRNFWRYGLNVPYELKLKGRKRTATQSDGSYFNWQNRRAKFNKRYNRVSYQSDDQGYRNGTRSFTPAWARNVEVRRLKVKRPGLDATATKTADMYLTWKYGIRPILQEIYALIELALDAMEGDLLSVEGVSIWRRDNAVWSGPGLRFRDQLDMKSGCKVGISYQVARADLVTLNSLGLINPLELLWELAPLSFVVDWFLPVGEFLRNMTAYKGLEFHSGYRTFFAKGTCTRTDFGYKDSTYKYGADPVTISEQERMDRNKLSSFPLTGLRFKHQGLNLNQISVLLALIQQRT